LFRSVIVRPSSGCASAAMLRRVTVGASTTVQAIWQGVCRNPNGLDVVVTQ
jgi:hypothetical protein